MNSNTLVDSNNAVEPARRYKAWVISDGKVGRRNQCIGVAQKLPADITVIKLQNIQQDGGLAAHLAKRFGTPIPWPDIVLSSGNDAGDTAIKVKELSGKTTFIASITEHYNAFRFDFMSTIKHHETRVFYDDAVEMIGVPHKVTPHFIKHGMEHWRSKMQAILESEKPIISVLIGGDVNNEFRFTDETAARIGDEINQQAKKLNAAVLITNSPRIPPEAWRILRQHALRDIDQAYVHDCRAADGNPFPAMLGFADVIVTTGDSLSMCFEAASTGKPVYIMQDSAITPPLYKTIYGDLYERGFAKPYADKLEPYKVPSPPLDEAGRVAGIIAEKLRMRCQSK